MADDKQVQATAPDTKPKAKPKAKPKPPVQAEKKQDDPMRKVKIRLFKDNHKYKDPLYVNVNMKNYLIPRGRDVYVPYCVAMVIQQSLEQDAKTAMMIEGLTQDFEKRAQAAGI